MLCECKDKIILYEPKYAMQAYETWCPNHGYDNDCYICDIAKEWLHHPTFSTEKCVRHRSPEFIKHYNKKMDALLDKCSIHGNEKLPFVISTCTRIRPGLDCCASEICEGCTDPPKRLLEKGISD